MSFLWNFVQRNFIIWASQRWNKSFGGHRYKAYKMGYFNFRMLFFGENKIILMLQYNVKLSSNLIQKFEPTIVNYCIYFGEEKKWGPRIGFWVISRESLEKIGHLEYRVQAASKIVLNLLFLLQNNLKKTPEK